MRLTLRALAILVAFLGCTPLHFLWKLFGARSPWPQLFLRFAGRQCGLEVTIEGTPLTANVLYAVNHVSWLDILAVGGAVPAVFVARADVEDWPGVGTAARLNDTIFIEREMRRTVQGQANSLREALSSGRAVALFPEGTTEGGHEVLPFRASLFASLFPALPGVMVQPVAIDFGPCFDEAAWVGDETYGMNAKTILSRPGRLPVTLRFLAPIDPHAAGDRKALAAEARDEVVAALGAFAATDTSL
ncbi:MAG TPA: lysophospholipid acyltransferase family protein [Allosphingosinicella sp.]|jgi:1-acyl-sn-glycerol-3-phosphate acyltransferase